MLQVAAKILKIFKTQKQTNEVISGLDWRERAALHLDLDYAMAGIDELAAEFVPEALGWKWWAKTFNANPLNAKLELVDVLHFLASEDMVRIGNVDEDGLESRTLAIAIFYFNAVELCASYASMAADPGSASNEVAKMVFMKRLTKNLLISFADEAQALDWTAYFSLCILVDSSFDDQYNLYVGKAVLNRFRAENGYKLGTYVKKWLLPGFDAPIEDNSHLTAWLLTQGAVTEVQIHAFLTETYSRHVIAA